MNLSLGNGGDRLQQWSTSSLLSLFFLLSTFFILLSSCLSFFLLISANQTFFLLPTCYCFCCSCCPAAKASSLRKSTLKLALFNVLWYQMLDHRPSSGLSNKTHSQEYMYTENKYGEMEVFWTQSCCTLTSHIQKTKAIYIACSTYPMETN